MMGYSKDRSFTLKNILGGYLEYQVEDRSWRLGPDQIKEIQQIKMILKKRQENKKPKCYFCGSQDVFYDTYQGQRRRKCKKCLAGEIIADGAF